MYIKLAMYFYILNLICISAPGFAPNLNQIDKRPESLFLDLVTLLSIKTPLDLYTYLL